MSARVLIALLASVALHVGVFAALAKTRESSTTTIVAKPAATPVEWISVDLAPRPSAPAPAPPAPPAPTASRRPRAAPRAVPSASPPEPTEELVDVGLSAPTPEVGSSSGTAVLGAIGRGTNGALGGDLGPQGSNGEGGRDLSVLHARLSAAAAHCYPASARRFRIRGRTDVSFCIGADGSVSRIERRKSSGSAVLDRAAIECVLPRAAPLPGPGGCFTAPIVFDDAR